MPEGHFEPFIHLAGLTAEAALIAWGGFYFQKASGDDDGWRLVDDEQLPSAERRERGSIGAASAPYGKATVEVRDASGALAGRATTERANNVIVAGLRPDTEYTYRIVVNGEPWAEGERWDWVRSDDRKQGLRPAGCRYDNRFRTHPHPETSAPLTFALLGDYGVGVLFDSPEAHRQIRVARALERAVQQRGVRLLLTAGDNIYMGPDHSVSDSGAEDDDWYFSFYQPYRYIINRIPVYPAAGNHDSGEEEQSDDRAQLEDNFFTVLRFEGDWPEGRASEGSDLCYQFSYGADIEFICLDTSLPSDSDERFFERPQIRAFLDSVLPDLQTSADRRARWRIPYSHHPPYCAGPHHANMDSMIDQLVPLFQRAGVVVAFSGHEHNFQLSRCGGITYLISGAGGMLRDEPPRQFVEAHTEAWAAEEHFLLVEINGRRMEITPIAGLEQGNDLQPLELRAPGGETVPTPIVVDRG